MNILLSIISVIIGVVLWSLFESTVPLIISIALAVFFILMMISNENPTPANWACFVIELAGAVYYIISSDALIWLCICAIVGATKAWCLFWSASEYENEIYNLFDRIMSKIFDFEGGNNALTFFGWLVYGAFECLIGAFATAGTTLPDFEILKFAALIPPVLTLLFTLKVKRAENS